MCRRGCSLGCRCRCRGMRPYIKLHGRRRVCCQLEWSMGRRVMQVPVVCVCLCVFSSWSRAVVRRSDRQRDGRGRTDGRSAVFRRLSQQIQGVRHSPVYHSASQSVRSDIYCKNGHSEVTTNNRLPYSSFFCHRQSSSEPRLR